MRSVSDALSTALPLPHSVPRETFARIERFAILVKEWQRVLNLIGKDEDLLTRHIADSAQLFPLLPSPDITLVDIGSGGGFPGVIFSLLGVRDVHLVESDRRKAAFLREAARVLETPLTVHAQRAETLQISHCDVLTARALAPLSDLFRISKTIRAAETICLFPKGENYSIEVTEARRKWAFDCEEIASKTGPGAVLRITHIHPL